MSVWNKYGEIKNGKITANLRATGEHIDYRGCHEIFTAEPTGDKFDQPAEAAIVNGKVMALINGTPYAYLPTDWTQFVGEIARRGPLKGTGSVMWRKGEFVARIDLQDA